MRLGIVVDGQAERHALPDLIRRVDTPFSLVGPVLYAPAHPEAAPGQIARAVQSRFGILAAKRVDRAVLLIDRETRDECPGTWAVAVRTALAERLVGIDIASIEVVVKDRKFENWLIADIEALRSMPKRFRLLDSEAAAIAPNRADAVDAERVLRRAAVRDAYAKIDDAVKILQRAAPLRIAANSRSFRRLLRVTGSAAYASQSRQPAPGTQS